MAEPRPGRDGVLGSLRRRRTRAFETRFAPGQTTDMGPIPRARVCPSHRQSLCPISPISVQGTPWADFLIRLRHGCGQSGRVWTGGISDPKRAGFVAIRDARTGDVVFERPPDSRFRTLAAGHNRCHRNKATPTVGLIPGRSFLEWMDTRTGDLTGTPFVRGQCAFGVLPANGLTYVPPNACMCAFQRQISGFPALGQANATAVSARRDPVRTTGPAFTAELPAEASDRGAWPTYRGDPSRSGMAGGEVDGPVPDPGGPRPAQPSTPSNSRRLCNCAFRETGQDRGGRALLSQITSLVHEGRRMRSRRSRNTAEHAYPIRPTCLSSPGTRGGPSTGPPA